MKEKDKGLAILVCVIIDLVLFSLLYFRLINTKQDFIYTGFLFFLHLIYYYGVYYNITYLIDITHISIPISFCIAPLLDSIYLKVCNFILLIVIQVLWLYKGYCIMETTTIKGCGDLITIVAFIWTLVLGYIIVNH